MKSILEKIYRQYFAIREESDAINQKLENLHADHLKCKAGCDLCCMDYSILPVEFHAILHRLKTDNPRPGTQQGEDETRCIFLVGHKCTIYSERPMICRTHGLPLLFMNDDGAWELSACELNFVDYDLELFTEKNTFPQDTFNSKLFMLNKEFVKEFTETDYGEFDLIPVRKLTEYL